MTDITHVYSDLVCAPCFQNNRCQRIAIAVAECLKMSDGAFSPGEIHTPLQQGPLLSGNGSAYGAGRGKLSSGNGQIFPVNLSAYNHVGQKGGAQHVFGHDEKTRGIPVQTVDTSKHKGLSHGKIVVDYPIG